MPVAVALWGVVALFAAAVLAIAIHRVAAAGRIIYLICLVACLANLGGAGASLFAIGYGMHEKSPGASCRSIRCSSVP